MRYYLETFIEQQQEFIIIKTTTSDYEEFLSFKLERFPLYIAPVSSRKWLIWKVHPDITIGRVAGAERIELNKPIQINYAGIQDRTAYREELLNLLIEWLADCTEEFQLHWKALTVSM